MRRVVTRQRTSVSRSIVGYRHQLIWGDNVYVEVDESLSRNRWAGRTHTMRRVAYGARKPFRGDMKIMLRPTSRPARRPGSCRVRDNNAQVVALRAHRVRALVAQIWRGVSIRDSSTGGGSLRELIIALQNMWVNRTVRSIRTRAAEFAIIVATVAVRAKDRSARRAHRPSGL